MIGASQTALKKLYGARFTAPSGPVVEIHPTGRGAMIALNGSCGRRERSRRCGLVEDHALASAPFSGSPAASVL